MFEMPGTAAPARWCPPLPLTAAVARAEPDVSGLGLLDGDEPLLVVEACCVEHTTPGDGDGVRTSGDSGLLCHDLRRLLVAAAADRAATLLTLSLCLRPESELGRPPETGDDDCDGTLVAVRSSAGDPGALDPGELLCDDELPVEWAESDIQDSTAAFDRSSRSGGPPPATTATVVVGEFGTPSYDDIGGCCGDDRCCCCCSAAFLLLSCRNNDARRRVSLCRCFR